MKYLVLCLIFGPSISTYGNSRTCDLKSTTTELEILQSSILNQKGCANLQKFMEKNTRSTRKIQNLDAEENEDKLYSQFEKEYTSCQAALFKACYPSLKSFIPEEELNLLFTEWRSNSDFNMKTPEVHCLERAYLLAKEMTEKGFTVSIAQIQSPSIVGLFKLNEKLLYYEYNVDMGPDFKDPGVHYVVLINAKTKSGELKQMLLDPQFAKRPMEVDQYAKLLTGQNVSKSLDPLDTKIAKFLPTAVPDLNNFQLAFSRRKSFLTDPCGWHKNKEYKKDIEEINTWNFSTGSTVPENLSSKGEDQIAKALQLKNLISIKDSLQFQIKQTEEFNNLLKAGKYPVYGADPLDTNLPANSWAKKNLEELSKDTKRKLIHLQSLLPRIQKKINLLESNEP